MAGVAATAAYCQYWNGSPFMLGGRSAPRANAVITMQSTEKRKEAAIRRNPRIPKLTAAAAAAAEDKRLMSEKNSPSPKGTITVSSNIYTLLPLRESPGVSFDEYLSDRPRIFKAMFAHQHKTKRLSDEEWRIHMLPLQLLFMTANPVVVMRLRSKSEGKVNPPGVPQDATSFVELQATKWELEGLDSNKVPSYFALNIEGVLYANKGSHRARRLRGSLEMSISVVLPTMLPFFSENAWRSVIESVLKSLAEKMKHDVDTGLIADFKEFRREKLRR
ncbi:hypothetical protein ACMD2_10327 [Ananas comosus]|uniref:Uncharacterized protein n=1 Tax=Ananas comosus TaxID=4615 RepID=A0A199UDH8_ANACO|nr:hypothetical protein ACMD2_10327 [Ananas comosus]